MGKQGGNKKKVSNFARKARLHEFRSGRAVIVNESLSYMWVMGQMARRQGETESALAALAGGVNPLDGSQSAVDALRMQDAIVQELVREPRVLIPEVDDPLDDDEYGSGWCWVSDFTDDELSELLELAAGGVRDAAGFPGVGVTVAGGEGGEVLGDVAEPVPGVAGGVVAGGDG